MYIAMSIQDIEKYRESILLRYKSVYIILYIVR